MLDLLTSKLTSYFEIERIAEFVPGGFFVYHAYDDQGLIYANKAVMRIYGCQTLDEFKELTGYTFKGMVHPDDWDGLEESIHHQIKENDESLDHLQFRARRKDGKIVYIMDFGRYVEHPDFGPVFFVFIEDLTWAIKTAQSNMIEEALDGNAAGPANPDENNPVLDGLRAAMQPR